MSLEEQHNIPHIRQWTGQEAIRLTDEIFKRFTEADVALPGVRADRLPDAGQRGAFLPDGGA